MAQIRFHNGAIDLHVLPPVAAINGARIRELTGDETFSEATEIILRVFKAVVGERTFHVGSALAMEKHSAPLELPSWSAWRQKLPEPRSTSHQSSMRTSPGTS